MRSLRLVFRELRAFSAAVVAVLAVLSGLSLPAEAQERPVPPITESTVDEIENYLEARLSEVGRPGLAAAVVHDGDVVSTFEFGHARPGVPMTSETPMFIASVSKSITAMALMQQVDAGRVDLDEPVTTYLPELAPEGNRVAVRDLMHHRSGLTRYVGNESWSGDLGSSLETNVRRLGPHLEANTPFGYSNANYDAIALIVQRVSETPFGEYVSENLFTPLEMNASFVGPNDSRHDVADGHYHWLFLGYRPYDQSEPPGMVGSAVMYSTAGDLANFLIAHLQGGTFRGSEVVSEDSVERLHTPESLGIELPEDYPVDAGYAGGLQTFASFRPDVDQDLARMITLTHGGSANGYRASIWMIPEVDLGFVALSNARDLADETWLPQVAQGVKHLVFGLEPLDVEVHSPFLFRYSKQLMLALVLVQVVLAGLAIRAWRGDWRRWSHNAVMIAASVTDLTALAVIVWVVPTVGETPLRVVVQAPDIRILMSAMTAGVLWGLYRTYMVVRKKGRAAASAAQALQPG